MRIPIAAVLAACLFATNALAGEATPNLPLAPGKPAGVKTAQDQDNTVLYILGGAAVIAGIALLASSDNGGNGSNNGAAGGGGSGGTSGSSP